MAAFSNSHYQSINFVTYFSPMIHIVNLEAPWTTPFTLTAFFFIVLLFTQITFKNVQQCSWCQNHVSYVGCHIERTFAYNLHVSCRTAPDGTGRHRTAPSGAVCHGIVRCRPVPYAVWTSLKCSKIKHVHEILRAKQTRKIWCNNIYALHRYRNFCVGTFYSDSPCMCSLSPQKLNSVFVHSYSTANMIYKLTPLWNLSCYSCMCLLYVQDGKL